MEKKILFITSRLNSTKSGGYLVSKRNYENLNKIFKGRVDIFKIEIKTLSRIINIVLFKRLELSSPQIEKKVLAELEKNVYKIVFIDNSGLGYLCEKIKKKYPNLKIIVFCHDINYHLF